MNMDPTAIRDALHESYGEVVTVEDSAGDRFTGTVQSLDGATVQLAMGPGLPPVGLEIVHLACVERFPNVTLDYTDATPEPGASRWSVVTNVQVPDRVERQGAGAVVDYVARALTEGHAAHRVTVGPAA